MNLLSSLKQTSKQMNEKMNCSNMLVFLSYEENKYFGAKKNDKHLLVHVID